MKLDVGQSERGWEVTYDGIFGAEEESPFFETEGEARKQCEREAAEWSAWAKTYERTTNKSNV